MVSSDQKSVASFDAGAMSIAGLHLLTRAHAQEIVSRMRCAKLERVAGKVVARQHAV